MDVQFNESSDLPKSFGSFFSTELTYGIKFLTDFWQEKYLQEYIRDGGSKIKFVTGRQGSGKTYFLRLMKAIAEKENYRTIQFSAKDIWVHDFKEIYVEIFQQCDIMKCLEAVSRQLIDDIDSMKHIMFVYAFDRELSDNENAGLKSYQALWMRIQNDIVGERFNRFADTIDMDRLAAQKYTPEVIVAISESLAGIQNNVSVSPLDRETAAQFAERARTGAVGIPRLIQIAIQEVDTDV